MYQNEEIRSTKDYRKFKHSFVKTLNVTVTNLAPENGNLLSPMWFGLHDGSYTTYTLGTPASLALKRLAEDGNTGPLTTAFSSSNAGIVQGSLFGTDDIFESTFPGSVNTLKVVIDGSLPTSRYFSYAAMILPSNDAFIANENPMAHQVFDEHGCFIGADILVCGNEVRDAGTEVNDEAPLHAAGAGPVFLRAAGVAENGTVHVHQGYQPGGTILSIPMFANADFKADGIQLARITITED